MSKVPTTTEVEEKKVKSSEFFQICAWVFKLFFTLSPFLTLAQIVTNVLGRLQPIVYAYLIAKVLDLLISMAQNKGASVIDLIPYVLVLFSYRLFSDLLDVIDISIQRVFESTTMVRIRMLFFEKLYSLGIATLEDPENNNLINRVTGQLSDLSNFIRSVIMIIALMVSFVTSGFIIITNLPILAPFLILATVPNFFIDKHFRDIMWKFIRDNTEKVRKNGTTIMFLTDIKALMEITVTNSFGYLSNIYQKVVTKYESERLGILQKWLKFDYGFSIIEISTVYVGYLFIFNNLIKGFITVGTVSFQMRVLDEFQATLKNILERTNNLFAVSLRVKDVYDIFHAEPMYIDGTELSEKLLQGPKVTLRDINFKYPTSRNYIFKNLNLNIKSGEKIAIVGHNGAGKTTLVKLISRIYQVNAGEILFENINVNDLKLEELNKNIGILFQDYNRYEHLSVRENIVMGDPSIQVDDKKIIDALKRAEAWEFVEKLPNKLDQLLSVKFKEGTNLSTGQWQKIAIARFFYRGSPLIIFDEPTASIDAESEYRIFNRIYEFFEDKTVIIISHRFSTVRNADRILVIDQGEIAEQGTHEELLKIKDGKYKTAFEIQKKGYE